MKLLVVSDTHGYFQPLLNLADKYGSEIDAYIHLGDGVLDMEKVQNALPKRPIYSVKGNCDSAKKQPAELLQEFNGTLFFCTHGHAYGVKEGLGGLCRKAKLSGAKAVLFGHTHVPSYVYENDIHFFNPGSLALPRFAYASYGLITIKQGQIGRAHV